VSLRSVPDLVATCIVLHNLCITMNDGFNENWISEAEEQLQRRIEIGALKELQELRCKKASIHEVKNRISYRENSELTNDIDDGEVETFVVMKNEKAVDLLREATRMYKILAKNLWYSKLQNQSTLEFSDSSSDCIEDD
jgi:hypothetical protein